MIFLIKGTSGSRQTSFPFFKVALQKEKKRMSPWAAGAEDPGWGDFPLANVTVYHSARGLTLVPLWDTADLQGSPADYWSFWDWSWVLWLNTRNAALSPRPQKDQLWQKERHRYRARRWGNCFPVSLARDTSPSPGRGGRCRGWGVLLCPVRPAGCELSPLASGPGGVSSSSASSAHSERAARLGRRLIAAKRALVQEERRGVGIWSSAALCFPQALLSFYTYTCPFSQAGNSSFGMLGKFLELGVGVWRMGRRWKLGRRLARRSFPTPDLQKTRYLAAAPAGGEGQSYRDFIFWANQG